MNIQPKITPVLDPGFVPGPFFGIKLLRPKPPPIPLLIKWISL